MADTKITALTELTTPSYSDPLAIVDDPTGTPATKKSTLANLIKYGVNGPRGFLINGKIVTSVATSDLTVAIKGIDGNDPSATNPVFVRIGDTVRAITAALSHTLLDATNWFNSGAAILDTNEIDYFVYLGYNATDGVVIGFARIPYGQKYNDFSTTSTNDNYCAISTITTAGATDQYENIGRFNAILSGTAAFAWSLPATSIVISRPIYETRTLYYDPTFGFTAGAAPSGVGNSTYAYTISGNKCHVIVGTVWSTAGTTVTGCNVPLPKNSAVWNQTLVNQPSFSNTFTTVAAMSQVDGNVAQMFCQSATINRLGFQLSYDIT